MYSEEIKDFAKEEERKIRALEIRDFNENNIRHQDREIGSIDYARVLYSSSFRRLQGKMQLLGVNPNNFHRNRLTHSLEVAQISRSLATKLGLKSNVFAETCALCHDLGNPPFGHYGEIVLNELSKEVGGYEGNAQTLRILRKLEKKHYNYAGLNLSCRTLFGVIKYFFTREHNQKKFLYTDDFKFMSKTLEERQISVTKSIDAQIMDLADEIAYAAHDLEDALSFGIINIDEITHEFQISEKYSISLNVFLEIVEKSRSSARQANRLKSSEEYSAVFRKELTSEIVHLLCKDIGIVTFDNRSQLGYKTNANLAEGLKKLLFTTILRKPTIQHYEKQGEKIIRGLYQVYSDESYNKNLMLLPPELRIIDDHKTRLIVDYISGMMDSFAKQEYEKYFGIGSIDAIYFEKDLRP